MISKGPTSRLVKLSSPERPFIEIDPRIAFARLIHEFPPSLKNNISITSNSIVGSASFAMELLYNMIDKNGISVFVHGRAGLDSSARKFWFHIARKAVTCGGIFCIILRLGPGDGVVLKSVNTCN